MSTKLKPTKGTEALRKLQRAGFMITRRKGTCISYAIRKLVLLLTFTFIVDEIFLLARFVSS